jgi:hypothetical protein
LIAHLNNGDKLLPQRLREHRPRTRDSSGTFAEAGAEPFRLCQPFIAEARRAGQEAIASCIMGAIEHMLQGRQIVHDAATISEGTTLV